MNDQEYLDILFGVRPADRRGLANGRVSSRLKRRLSEWRDVRRLALFSSGLLVLLTALLILFNGDPYLEREYTPAIIVFLFFFWPVPVALVGRWIFDLLHGRWVLGRGARVRVLEGTVQTEVTRVPVKTGRVDRDTGDWVETSEGDRVEVLFHLTDMTGQTTPTTLKIPKLEGHSISGWARIFLVTVPSRGSHSPSYETVAAIEVGPNTFVTSDASDLAEDSG